MSRVLVKHQTLVGELRRLHAAYRAAAKHEMCQEGARGHSRAVRATKALESKLLRLGESILARPIKSWSDVVLLGELAAALDAKDAGRLRSEGGTNRYTDPAHQALAALLNAVLELGRHAPKSSNRRAA
jgi:hypothetical protein